MTNEKLEVVQAELGTVHTSIEKLVGALISAKRKCEEEESHSNPSEKKIGKLRMEIRGNEHKLADLQQLRCERAQEKLAADYFEIQQELEQVRGAREGMVLQESSVTRQLAAMQDKIAAMDCAPSWQLSRLTQQVKKTVSGPLRRALEVKLAAEQQAHQAAVDQAAELESQLKTVKGELSDSGTREVALKAELGKILALGETHYRQLTGSLQEIRTALADPCVTVDRWAAEKLLQGWARGFTETLGASGAYGDVLRTIKFEVQEATILYWFDTGEVAGSVINSAMGDGEIWPKGRNVPLELEREALEAQRTAAGQPVAV